MSKYLANKTSFKLPRKCVGCDLDEISKVNWEKADCSVKERLTKPGNLNEQFGPNLLLCQERLFCNKYGVAQCGGAVFEGAKKILTSSLSELANPAGESPNESRDY